MPYNDSSIHNLEELTRATILNILPDAFFVTQEWDKRIDLFVELDNGDTKGEWIAFENVTEGEVKNTLNRLKMARNGESVQLINEIMSPIHIRPQDASS